MAKMLTNTDGGALVDINLVNALVNIDLVDTGASVNINLVNAGASVNIDLIDPVDCSVRSNIAL